jgi:enterochelin esterase-like enzyme
MSFSFPRFLRFWPLIILFLPACGPLQVLPQSKTPAPVASPTFIEKAIPILSTVPVPTTAFHTAPATCNQKTGSFQAGVINTDLLAKPMRYSVYLPACYTLDTKKRYPVLYLLHGQGYSEDQWIRIGAASTADRLMAAGDIPPFIIVFPFDYSNKQPTEYSFEEVFVQQLIPTIDHSYRTLDNASHRAIGGLSRGGAWALHIGASHPDLFGAIGGHSPAIFFSDQKSLPRNLLAIPSSQLPRIWLDAGDSDSQYTVIVSFEEFLSKNNLSHEWHEYIGWHDEKYWSAHVDSYLSWYALGWR